MLARLSLLALCASMASAENYAVLVCGSNEYYNYRHHADVAHAYQVLTRGGVKAENIITMMYDDVPHSSENPYPGQLFNKPASTLAAANDVYASVKDHIDYKGKQVTADTYLQVITGNASAGGKVLQSGPEDNVFLYFVDHGGPGILCFPGFKTSVHEVDLMNALQSMHDQKMYKNLVFFVDACESGSMFENLPADINVFAVTAATASESGYGKYCGSPKVGGTVIPSCLGEEFSCTWLEEADVTDLSTVTLQALYKIVQEGVIMSHPQEFGALAYAAATDADAFLGHGKTAPSAAAAVAQDAGERWSSRDMKLQTLRAQYLAATDAGRRSELAAALIAEVEDREAADAKFAALAKKLALPEELNTSTGTPYRHCLKPAHEAAREHCGYSDYSLKYASVVAGACNHWKGDTAKVVNATVSVCAGY
eukprot:TRINITY_DN389_c0_g1_i9.p1 TRINITY_DN389_c0_g1~~TRINITY_DN389_c0_g1_i9.p1  ORF type:complete len:425 (+),score=234.36 TRINITY_DN389_c0_g1_i9:64-1338(+)